MPAPANIRERLIVALDTPSAEAALQLISQIGDLVSFYKVGLELYTAAGPEFVRDLVSQGLKVFLDLKFLDIPETVRLATESAARLGASFLTVHESPKTVAAAVQGCQGSHLKILAVTVLTSMDDSEIREMGLAGSVEELVLRRARRAIAEGCHGLISSAREAPKLRSLSKDLILVTPGIRPAGAPLQDQKRATTPGAAIAAGADYLVVGRPIRNAPNPRAAAEQILAEMQEASLQRTS